MQQQFLLLIWTASHCPKVPSQIYEREFATLIFCLRQSASCRPEINPNVNPALKNFSARRFTPEDKFLEGLPLLLIAYVQRNFLLRQKTLREINFSY